MITTETDPYVRERNYIVNYIIQENPELQERFPSGILKKLISSLDDDLLLSLEADEIPIHRVYRLLSQKQRASGFHNAVVYDDDSPLPDNPLVDKEVERITEEILTPRRTGKYRNSQKTFSGNGSSRKRFSPGRI